eukprot:scpid59815/ scgid13811/ 
MSRLWFSCVAVVLCVWAAPTSATRRPSLPPELVLLRHVRQWAEGLGRAGDQSSTGQSAMLSADTAECSEAQCSHWRKRYTCSGSIRTSHLKVKRHAQDYSRLELVVSGAASDEERSCFSEVWLPLEWVRAHRRGYLSAGKRIHHLSKSTAGQSTLDSRHRANTSSWLVLDITWVLPTARAFTLTWLDHAVRLAQTDSTVLYRVHHFHNGHNIARTAFLTYGTRQAQDFRTLSEELKTFSAMPVATVEEHRSRRSAGETNPTGHEDEPTIPTQTGTTNTTRQKPKKRKKSKEQRRLDRKQREQQRLMQEQREQQMESYRTTTTNTRTPSPRPDEISVTPHSRSTPFCQFDDYVVINVSDLGWTSVIEPRQIRFRNCRGSCLSSHRVSTNQPASAMFTGYTKFALLKDDILHHLPSTLQAQGIPKQLSMCCVPTNFTDVHMLLHEHQPPVSMVNMSHVNSAGMDNINLGAYRYVRLQGLLPRACGCA